MTINNTLNSYDWFLRREHAGFIWGEKPTEESAKDLAKWINSHDCQKVSADEVYFWMYDNYLDTLTSDF